MRVVVIGGTGLIGSKVVQRLSASGHVAVAASPATGVDTVSGAGVERALDGADVVVDVSNSPSFEGMAALGFFTTSTSNLLAAEDAFGVRHHVALSVVGTDRLTAGGYFRAKLAQESMIRESPIPYSIVRATQFYEFIARITDSATAGGTVQLQPVFIQPLAADDVAGEVSRVAVEAALNDVVEVAGPQRFRLDELVRETLRSQGDARPVLTNPHAPYFGVAEMDENVLLPGDSARIAATRFDAWLRPPSARHASARRATAIEATRG